MSDKSNTSTTFSELDEDLHNMDKINEMKEIYDDNCDEFGDVENFHPVQINMNEIRDIAKTYTKQNKKKSIASSLLNPMKTQQNTLQ